MLGSGTRITTRYPGTRWVPGYVRSVEAILQIRYGLKLANENCVTFKPSLYMLKHFFDKGTDTEDNPNEDDKPVAIFVNDD